MLFASRATKVISHGQLGSIVVHPGVEQPNTACHLSPLRRTNRRRYCFRRLRKEYLRPYPAYGIHFLHQGASNDAWCFPPFRHILPYVSFYKSLPAKLSRAHPVCHFDTLRLGYFRPKTPVLADFLAALFCLLHTSRAGGRSCVQEPKHSAHFCRTVEEATQPALRQLPPPIQILHSALSVATLQNDSLAFLVVMTRHANSR